MRQLIIRHQLPAKTQIHICIQPAPSRTPPPNPPTVLLLSRSIFCIQSGKSSWKQTTMINAPPFVFLFIFILTFSSLKNQMETKTNWKRWRFHAYAVDSLHWLISTVGQTRWHIYMAGLFSEWSPFFWWSHTFEKKVAKTNLYILHIFFFFFKNKINTSFHQWK